MRPLYFQYVQATGYVVNAKVLIYGFEWCP